MKCFKKCFLCIFLVLSLGLLPLASAFAAEPAERSVQDFSYTVLSQEEKTCLITKYKGSDTRLALPDSLEGYKVTAIGKFAFITASALTDIEIPEGVTDIYDDAFYNCTALKSITLPSSVVHIGEYAFSDTALFKDEANWENGVLYIGRHLIMAKNTIHGQYAVKEGTLTVAGSAFRGCTSLGNITIPSSVISIGNWAFYGCSNLKNAVLSNGLQYIGCGAFSGCLSLKAVKIPDSASYLGFEAFSGCSSLSDIALPDTLHIEEQAFRNTAYYNNESNWKNSALYIGNCLIAVKEDTEGSFTVKAGTKNIADMAFADCFYLTDVKIPNGVPAISSSAFLGCKNLKTVTIPDSVKIIGARAFSDCPSLTEIALPMGLTEIGDYAFEHCSSLLSVAVPKSVQSIGTSALGYAYNAETDKLEVIDGFKIYGHIGSAAEKYANENNIKFIDLSTVNFVLGDVNGDGKVTAVDARIALQNAAKKRSLDELQLAEADMNGDGKITAVDARQILKKAAGK